MTNNNDLWELDRQDYVAIVTELRADLAAAEQSLSLARTDQATAERAREIAERERDEALAALEMQRIDREDAQDDADVAEAIDEARWNDLVARKDGWRRVALYWRSEWRLYVGSLIGDEYIRSYIRLGSESRRRNKQADRQAGKE